MAQATLESGCAFPFERQTKTVTVGQHVRKLREKHERLAIEHQRQACRRDAGRGQQVRVQICPKHPAPATLRTRDDFGPDGHWREPALLMPELLLAKLNE